MGRLGMEFGNGGLTSNLNNRHPGHERSGYRFKSVEEFIVPAADRVITPVFTGLKFEDRGERAT